LGLTKATSLAKRAIQFGSKVGKVFFPSRTSKVNGADQFVLGNE
jgi:hypothetical protein